MGTPELPGIQRRIYYISKNQIVKWPKFQRDSHGRVISAVLRGNFLLAADASWKFITILPDKSQLTSEAQGAVQQIDWLSISNSRAQRSDFSRSEP